MNNSIYIQISAFIYSIVLMLVYFNKKRYRSFENSVYSLLVICNFLGLIIDIALGIFSAKYEDNILIVTILTKFYLLYFIIWISLFTYYVLAISRTKFALSLTGQEKTKSNKRKILIFGLLCLCVIEYILPVKISRTKIGVHSYGFSTNLVYIISGIDIVICLISLAMNAKNRQFKKYIPLFLFISAGGIVMLIQYNNPALILLPAFETLITFTMYFTIENPDIKMLEEMHKAKEISDSSNEDKAMFLYNITSETRGIMQDIDAEADIILGEMDNKKVNVENVNTSARNIKSSTARFTTMINEILDVSKIDSSNIKVYNEKYNVKLIIREIYSMYKGKCDSKGLEFRLNIAKDVPGYLYGDSIGLKKVLVTIMDNAYSYTDRGYIELRVNVVKKSDVARLVIVVEDSGRGIKAEELDRIFEIRKNEKTNNDDLDSNLYNARRLITVIGGTIVPSSSLGKGTSIKIILDQKIAEEESNLKKYEKIYDKKNILLVDDNEASGKIFSKLFNDTNIVLNIVTSGKECLDKIRNKEKYDLILLDEDMSPLNGFEVMNKLKDIRNFNTKVMLLTRDNSYEYKDDYLDYGFVDYLLKPINKDTLFQKLEKYLN